MRLNVHEWGDPTGPPVVCLHGVTGHGERFKRLAEEHWSRFRVLAPDLRGHGRSGWEPPWTLATHVADLLETIPQLIGDTERADWVGHSFGGRLILELAARQPERIRRAVLLDPAIHLLPHVAEFVADNERRDPVYADADDYASRRDQTSRTDLLLEDIEQHCEVQADGTLRRRTSQSAVVSIFGELATEPPHPETLTMPTLLVHAPAYGLVRDEHLEAYAAALQVAVPGMHMVIWDAFDQVAEAVSEFLAR